MVEPILGYEEKIKELEKYAKGKSIRNESTGI